MTLERDKFKPVARQGMITRSVNILVVTHLKISYPIFNSYLRLLLLFLPTSPLMSAPLHFFHPYCMSAFSFFFCLCSTSLHLALIVSFFPLFRSFCPLSKSPCHLSSLLSSIYICLFLPCPSLTSHSPFPSFICFLPVFPLCFSLSLSCSLAIPTLSVFLFLANHYSFSFVSSEALFCKMNPPPPSSLSPCLRSLFILIVLFQWQGGAAGLAPHYCCRHCWAMMVVVCECV